MTSCSSTPCSCCSASPAPWCRRTGESRVTFLRNVLQVGLYTALIVGAGGLFTGLTVVMAEMLELDTVPIAVHLMSWGGASALAFAHHVWLRQPDALNKVLPLIAGLFIPLFVLLESGFLLTYLAKGLDALSRDREELLVFNLLLGAVIGLVLLHSALQDSETRLGRSLRRRPRGARHRGRRRGHPGHWKPADGMGLDAEPTRGPRHQFAVPRHPAGAGPRLCPAAPHAELARRAGRAQPGAGLLLDGRWSWPLAFPGYQAFQNRAFDPVALGISTAEPQSQLEADLEAVEQEVAAKEAELEEASARTRNQRPSSDP